MEGRRLKVGEVGEEEVGDIRRPEEEALPDLSVVGGEAQFSGQT